MNRILSMAAVLSVITAVPASAACTQADLRGNWSENTLGTTLGLSTAVHCSLAINALGDIVKPSKCVSSTGKITVATGGVHLASAGECRYYGTLTFSPTGGSMTLSYSTMTENKQLLEGVGYNGLIATTGASILVNMIKVS
jgi:hypothetical protein